MKKLLLVILIVTAVAISGCKKPSDTGTGSDLSVVCSTTSLTAVAKTLSENTAISIHQIVPDNMNVHTFTLTQKDMKCIQDAKLVIIYSLDLEFWADKVPERKLLVINENLKNYQPVYADKKSINPHTWLDPVYMEEATDLIAEAFSRIDPAEKSSFQDKQKKLEESLQKLHKNIKTEADAGMFSDTLFICSHPSLAYFFREYGITDVEYIQSGDGQEPSLQHINSLITKAKNSKRCVVICEEQIKDRAADMIIKETGAEKIVFNPQPSAYTDELHKLAAGMSD